MGNGFSSNLDCASPVVSCPLQQNDSIVCNLLQLSVIDETHSRSVRCDRQLAGHPVPENLPDHAKKLLAHYDLLLETVAAPSSGKEALTATPVRIHLEPVPEGTCPDGHHVAMHLDAESDSGSWRNQTATVPFFAQPRPNLLSIAESLRPVWPFTEDNVKNAPVVAYSCGVSTGAHLNRTLKALVRIYSSDRFKLSLSMPPWYKKEIKSETTHSPIESEKRYTNETKRAGDVTRSRSETEKRDLLGTERKSEETTRRRDGSSVTETAKREPNLVGGESTTEELTVTKTAKSAGGLLKTSTSTKNTWNPIVNDWGPARDPKTKREVKAGITLERNGEPLDVQKLVNNILNIAQLIKDAADLANYLPKVGYGGSFSFAFLEGAGITGHWGAVAAGPRGERYALVENDLWFSIDVTLLKLKLSAWFGIDFSLPELLKWLNVAELVLKVQADHTSSAKIKAEFASTKDPEKNVKLAGELNVYAKGRGSIMGESVEAVAGGKAALEGKFTCKVTDESPFSLYGEGKFTGCVVYATFFDTVGLDEPRTAEHELFKERVLFSKRQIL